MPTYSPLKRCLFLILLLILFFQALLIGICSSSAEENLEYLGNLDLLENDFLSIYISPPVENISVRCQPLISDGTFDLSISTNYVNPYLEDSSVLWIQPSKSGIYNLTLIFASNKTWKYLYGVYTENRNFYIKYYGIGKTSSIGSFVELRPPQIRQSGNWRISATLNVHSSSPITSPIIVLPAPANLAILISIVSLIAYVESFVFLNTYFKSKKETISNTRWVLVGIILLIGIYLAYQTYNFTVFTLSGGGD